jgi:protein gp37
MGRSTPIEWTEHTWNPFVGCSRVSDGCKNCYAIPQAARIESFGNVPHYDGVTKRGAAGPNWSGRVALASESVLSKPQRLPAGSLVFVNSMSDFWHERATDEMRKRALDVMRSRPDVAFQVLTKRPENILPALARMKTEIPENMWAGCTVESSKVVGRIDILRRVPATVRFLSVEPLLDDLVGLADLDLTGIHWVITGGESGPGARPMQAEWVRGVRDACNRQAVPHFFKQWGDWRNNPIGSTRAEVEALDPIGKGGSLLDGQPWKEMPPYFWERWGKHRGAAPAPEKGQRFLPLLDPAKA